MDFKSNDYDEQGHSIPSSFSLASLVPRWLLPRIVTLAKASLLSNIGHIPKSIDQPSARFPRLCGLSVYPHTVEN